MTTFRPCAPRRSRSQTVFAGLVVPLDCFQVPAPFGALSLNDIDANVRRLGEPSQYPPAQAATARQLRQSIEYGRLSSTDSADGARLLRDPVDFACARPARCKSTFIVEFLKQRVLRCGGLDLYHDQQGD
jgi:hypothetical protein